MECLRSIVAAALAAGGLLMGPSAWANDPVKIRSSYVTAPGTLVPLLFNDGYRDPALLKNYGKSYTVETITFRGSAPQITAMAAGEVDIIQVAFSSLVFTIENAKLHDVRVISDVFQSGTGGHLTANFMVRKDDTIKKVEDLRGRTIAINAFGGTLDIATQVMLRRHGLTPPADYTAVEVQIPNMVSTLASKRVDMIGMGMPWIDVARRTANAETLFTMNDALGDVQDIMMAARSDFLAKNRAALNDFFEDYVRGLRWFLDPANRDAALAIIAKFNKRSPSDYASYVLTKQDYYRDPYAFPNLTALQRSIDLMREFGFSKKKIDVKNYVDLSFVEQAKRRIGGETPAGRR